VLVDIRSMPPEIQAEARRQALVLDVPHHSGITPRHAALSFRVMSTDAVSGTRPRSRLERRIIAAAEALLAHDGSVSPVDMLAAIGWLPQSTVDRWRQGRVECLEELAPVRPDKLAAALEYLRGWAAGKALAPSEVAYVGATRDRRPLRFTADGNEATERAWGTHWMRADLPEAARERLTRRQSKLPDLMVIEPLNDRTYAVRVGRGG
jgi:hypothetical protein